MYCKKKQVKTCVTVAEHNNNNNDQLNCDYIIGVPSDIEQITINIIVKVFLSDILGECQFLKNIPS